MKDKQLRKKTSLDSRRDWSKKRWSGKDSRSKLRMKPNNCSPD